MRIIQVIKEKSVLKYCKHKLINYKQNNKIRNGTTKFKHISH